MRHIHQFKDVISLWPTAADFGRDLGIEEVHARAMKRRNSIPSKYWDSLVNAASEQGFVNVTHEALAKIAGKTQPKNTRKQ